LTRWVGTAVLLGLGGLIGLAPPAVAADPTATVSFTNDGVADKSITIQPGTDVVFSNDIDPTQTVPILGGLTGALHSVSVTVTGATQNSFTLKRGQEATVSSYTSGSKPFVIHFTGTYAAANLGIPDPNEHQYDGTITVAATAPQSPPPSSNPTSSPPSDTPPQVPSSGSSTGSTGGSGGSTTKHTGSPHSPGPTLPGYQQPPPDVASQVMPHGSGGTYRDDSTSGGGATGSADTIKPSGSGSTDTPRTPRAAGPAVNTQDGSNSGSDTVAEQPAARNSANEQPLDTAASHTQALPFAINWPAIAAVALLSTVAVALVRTFVAHRRG